MIFCYPLIFHNLWRWRQSELIYVNYLFLSANILLVTFVNRVWHIISSPKLFLILSLFSSNIVLAARIVSPLATKSEKP